VMRIQSDTMQGIEVMSRALEGRRRAVAVFGSARLPESDPAYQLAQETCRLLGEKGFAVITGGGPGIMEAANRGARDAKSLSIGLNIELPHEQSLNPYCDASYKCHYFFVRKMMFAKYSRGFIIFPGGFGTLDELFESDTELINSLGVRPKLEFEYPTSIKNISFVPKLEVAFNRSLDTSNKVLSGAVSAGFLHRRNGDDKNIRTRIRVKYGSEYELDGLNFDDYLELSLKVYLQEQRGFRVGKRHLTITPFGEVRRFTDTLEFVTESGAVFDVETQYEFGLEFNTDPRKKILGIALPRLKLSYVFGDDFKGIKIRI